MNILDNQSPNVTPEIDKDKALKQIHDQVSTLDSLEATIPEKLQAGINYQYLMVKYRFTFHEYPEITR